MPSAIPDRFRLEMRLGRDEDVEEWLATDVSLDRPVLIRSLGPESSPDRRDEFVANVSRVASVSHPHLLKVFAVEMVPGGAYAVVEWTGGSTIADHLVAGRSFDLAEFLPNASGLAGALAAMHDDGAVHGSLDATSISYSVAHPAKLGGFGRVERTGLAGDVSGLASVLETAITGSQPGGPPPSERVDGLSPSIDRILRAAQTGTMQARDLEKALTAAPTPRDPEPEPRAGSRRLLYAAASLVALAMVLVGIGFFFAGGSGQPILPDRPPDTTTPPSTIVTTTTIAVGLTEVTSVVSFDPLGEGGEHEEEAILVIDGDLGTSWNTESYDDPLPLVKEGVGLVFTVDGTPTTVDLFAVTPGTGFEMRWSPSLSEEIEVWERVASATAPAGGLTIQLPLRVDGHWLMWITDLPQASDATFHASVAEVRFGS